MNANSFRWTAVVAGLTVVVSIGLPLLGLRVFHASDSLQSRAPWRHTAPVDASVTNPLLGDTVDAALPNRAVFRTRVHRGEYPLWSGLTASGTPLGTVPTGGRLSPLNLPYLTVPLWYAPALSKLLELLAAIGLTFLFLRRIGIGRPAALFGGLVFAFTGFQVVWTNWPQTQVGALIPGVFWGVELAIQRRSVRSALPLAIVTAAMLLGGFPPVAGYALLAAGAYALVRVLADHGSSATERSIRLAVLGGAVALGIGLTAATLLPLTHHVGELDLGYRVQTPESHLPIEALATMAIPDALGSPVDEVYFGSHNYAEIHSFVGASVLALIIAASLRRRAARVVRGAAPFLWTGAVVTLVVVFFGGPLLAALQKLPLFELNFVGRMRAVIGFLFAGLAALAMETVAASPETRGSERWRPVRLVAVAALAAVMLVAVARAGEAARAAGLGSYFLRQALLPFAVGVAALLVVVLGRTLARHGPRLIVWSLPVLFAVEAIAFVGPYWPRVDKDLFYPATSTHRFITANLGPDRIAASGAMWPGTTSVYGIRSVTGHTFHATTWRESLLAVDPETFDRTPTISFLGRTSNVATSPILDRMAARFFVTPPEAPVLGGRRQVSAPSEPIPFAAGSSLDVPIPPGSIRGILLRLDPRDVPDRARSYLSAEILDQQGTVVAAGTLRLRPGASDNRYTIPVTEPDPASIDPSSTWTARIGLLAPAGVATVLADDEGAPALTLALAEDDDLRLEFVDGAVVYRRLQALPRIRWASRSRVIPQPAERLRFLRASHREDEVVLSEPGPRAEGAPARLRTIQDQGDVIRVRAEAEDAGYLVVADGMQHGWKARLNGRAVPLRAADHALSAVHVPAGEHEVVFTYDPPGWNTGRAVSLVSFTTLLALALGAPLVARWRRRAKP